MTYTERAKQLRPYIEKAAQFLDDVDALQAKTLYPSWAGGVTYEAGYRVLYDGDLYRVRQGHTSMAHYPPGIDTASLYERIDETHAGTKDDPIPYEGNMELFEGKYYSQGGVTYYCNRSTGIPVYNALADLVGLYVEVAV